MSIIQNENELCSALQVLVRPQHKNQLMHNADMRAKVKAKLNELARPANYRADYRSFLGNIDSIISTGKAAIIDPPLLYKMLVLNIAHLEFDRVDHVANIFYMLTEYSGQEAMKECYIRLWNNNFEYEERKKLGGNSLSVETYMERLEYLFNYYQENLTRYEATKATERHAKIWKLSFKYYFVNRFCKDFYSVEFLQRIPELDYNSMSESLLESLEGVCEIGYKSVHPIVIIEHLYKGRSFLSRESMRTLNNKMKKLVVCLSNTFIIHYLSAFVSTDTLNLMDIMVVKPEIWTPFLEFYLHIKHLYLEKYKASKTWENLCRIGEQFSQIILSVAAKAKNQQLTTELLAIARRDDLISYHSAWELLGVSTEYRIIEKCNDECLALKNYLQEVKNFCITFLFEDKKTINLLNEITQNFPKLTYWECQAIVRNLEKSGSVEKQSEIENEMRITHSNKINAISMLLLTAYPWLITIDQSKLFLHFKSAFLLAVENSQGENDMQSKDMDTFIMYLMKKFYLLFHNISNDTIPFAELAELVNILDAKELAILYEAVYSLFLLKLSDTIKAELFIHATTVTFIKKKKTGKVVETVVLNDLATKNDPKDDLNLLKSNQKHWIIGKVKKIKQYRHFSNIYGSMYSLERLTQSIPFLLVPNCAGLIQWQNSTKKLKEKFEEEGFNFDELTLNDLNEKGFNQESQNIPQSFPALNCEYFEKFLECYEVVDWIKSIKTDNDFSSSIELAIGKSEMECPTELWIPAQAHKPGRVDESKLSMVSALRRYFHKLIYSKHNHKHQLQMGNQQAAAGSLTKSQQILIELEKEEAEKNTPTGELCDIPWDSSKKIRKLFEYEWDDLVTIFDDIPEGRGGELLEYFDIINEYKYPLMELISSSSTSVSLLKSLFLKQSFSKWICDFNLPEGINLQWIVPRGNTSVTKQQSLTEITDFHSSIILSKSADTEEFQDIIDLFTSQFSWIKQLNDHLHKLCELGHFDYQNYHYEFSLLIQSHEPIRSEALTINSIIPFWIESVKTIRQKYYFLNYFTLKQIWKLIRTLEEINTTPDVDKYLKHLLGCFNLACASDYQITSDFIEGIKYKWNGYEKERKVKSEDKLEVIGRILNQLLCEYKPCIQYIPENIIEKDYYSKYFKKGVNLICTESKELVFDYILSIYSSLYYLPSREFIYICSSKTTEEDLLNFLYRWCYANKENQRESICYSIALPDLLSSELQRIFISNLKDLSVFAENNIVILTSSIENYVTSQLYQSRISISNALSLSELNHYSKLYEKLNSQGICVFTGNHAGCGKTFQIRKWSNKLSAEYIHFPITAIYDSFTSSILPSSSSPSTPSSEVVEHQKQKKTSIIARLMQLNEKYHEEEYLLIHLDLSETLYREFDEYLFELIYLGGLFDSKQQVEYIWNPQTTSFAIESPVDIHKKLRTVHLIPNQYIKVDASRFSVSEEELKQGMGPDFVTYRNDGTAKSKNFKNAVSAYQQLIYVCYTLDILVLNHGKFPFLPPSSLVDESNHTKNYINQLRHSIQLYQSTIRESAMFNDDQNRQKLTSERALELLLTATKLSDAEGISLWCVWNFIRLFYWLLREMHHPNSILNKIATPSHLHAQLGYATPAPPSSAKSEEHAEEGDEDAEVEVDYNKEERKKSSFKGEIIQLLIQTAQEISLRKEKGSNRITHAIVDGIPSYTLNGRWNRTLFDCHGKPCYHKKHYFLYYDKPHDCWIINNTIDLTAKIPYARCKSSNLANEEWYFSSFTMAASQGISATEVDQSGTKGYLIQGLPDYFFVSMNGLYIAHSENGKNGYKLQCDSEYALYFYFDEFYETWYIGPTMNGGKAIAYAKTYDLVDWLVFRNKSLEITEGTDNDYTVTKQDEPMSDNNQHALTEGKVEEVALNGNKYGQSMVSREEIEEMERMWRNTIKWNESNHDCILFSNKTNAVKILTLHPEQMKERLDIGLIERFEENGITIGESLDSLNEGFHEIISSLTEIERTKEEAEKLLDGSYCLTKDSVLKMLTIYARIRCGVPVVLLGECGCGKTMLIRYLCAWLGIKLFILDVNGGTTEDDIINIFLTASKYLEEDQGEQESIHENKHQVFVFLDEINTCPHMGLLCEAICHRSVKGRRIHEGICILAALNPYRKRNSKKNKATPGLVYQLHSKSEVFSDPMSDLVYRVHPIPSTLRDFIFDFGSLSDKDEKKYIKSMISSTFQGLLQKRRELTAEETEKLILEGQNIMEITELTPKQKEYNQLLKHNFRIVTQLISRSQIYIRTIEADPSVTSLRDVRRCLSLISWFMDKLTTTRKKEKYSTFACGTILSLAFVYYYRMADTQDRKKYWESINNDIILYPRKSQFEGLKEAGSCLMLLESIKKKFCENIKVEKGVAMNQALEENIFVLLICILNKIPVFLVGKPGSSKTLTLQVIASNLQGKQSENEFWKKFPSIHIFQYQCSPMSDSYSIQHQFDIAVRYQQHATDCITILLLDEVGLAEHSPDMPLKVLHTMLIEPSIAIVGVSNWVLDAAKMNRAICIQRTEPTKDDIQTTGESILNFIPIDNKDDQVAQMAYKRLAPKLACLARAYHEIYTNQAGSREFIGMRDYYHLIKCLCSELLRTKDRLDAPSLFYVVGRNFGGQPEAIKNYYKIFFTRSFTQSFPKNKFPPVHTLIAGNLNDTSSRHLMLLTQNSIALPLLFGCGFLDEREATVLVGSEFKEDKNELYLVTQINQVKQSMASGSTVILLNHDNIYEALYDVLNQRFLYKTDNKTGKVEKLLRLAIGSKSQLCQVKDGFKIIVIVEQEHAYNHLDLPLLNRFEKQVLTAIDILTTDQFQICKNILTDWVAKILKQSKLSTKQQVFCAFQRDTLPSLVISTMEPYKHLSKDQLAASMQEITDKIKYALGKIALPVAVRLSSELHKYAPDYFNNHSDLFSIIDHYIIKGTSSTHKSPQEKKIIEEYTTSNILITFSSITHIVIEEIIKENKNPYEVIQLAELPSERSLIYRIEEYYNNENNKNQLLIIQCDPISTKQTIIDHGKLLCNKYKKGYLQEKRNKINIKQQKHVLFIIHLPPGTKLRDRKFALHFQQGWECYFVDDLRIPRSSNYAFGVTNKLTILPYLDHPICDLIDQGVIDLHKTIKCKYQQSLSICLLPSIHTEEKGNMDFHRRRIKFYHDRIHEHLPSFDLCKEFLLKNVYKLLKFHCNAQDKKQLLFQIKMIISENCIGTQYHSLELAMNVLIIQELANLIAASDINFNLQTYTEESKELWIALSELYVVFDVNLAGSLCKIGENQLLLQTQSIKNTGMQQTLISKFPWSSKLIALLHNPSIKNKLYQLSQKPSSALPQQGSNEKEEERDDEMIEQLYQISKTILGEEILNLSNKYEHGCYQKYLHDFLASVLPSYPGIPFHLQENIYRILLSHHHQRTLQSFAGIHVGFWQIEQTALKVCFFFASVSLPKDIFNLLVDKINSFDTPVDQIDFKSTIVKERLSRMQYDILIELLNHMKMNFINKRYSEYFTSIRSNIELMMLSILEYLSNEQRNRIKREYLSLIILNIFLSEIIQPYAMQVISHINQRYPAANINHTDKDPQQLLENLRAGLLSGRWSNPDAFQNYDERITKKWHEFLALVNRAMEGEEKERGVEGLEVFREMVEAISLHYEFEEGRYNIGEQRRYIHRYIHEVLFGEQELFFRANLHLQISHALLNELENIVNYPLDMITLYKQYPDRFIQQNKHKNYLAINLHPEIIDISLRKIIIHCLIHYYSKQGKEKEGKEKRIQLHTMEAYQLYVSYLEDQLELDIPNKEDIYVINDTIEDLVATLNQEEHKNLTEYEKQSKIYSYLVSLSKIKKYLTLYTRTIIRLIMLKSGELMNELNNIINEEKIKWILNKNNKLTTILYTLKLFIHYGGLESIKDIIFLNEPAFNDWLPVNRELANKLTTILPDPFPAICGNQHKLIYHEINKLLISSVNTKAKLPSSELEKIKKAPIKILLSNFFQQFVCSASYTADQLLPTTQLLKSILSDKINREYNSYWKAITNMIEYDTSGWLNRSNSFDLSILQIGCHMIFNILDSDTQWYTILFNSTSSIHSYYLPSMPTDLVAIFSKTMTERLRWYMCPKGHPYSVGECGKPMQSYSCIHPGCGAKIGGASHIPHAGNTDWKANTDKTGYVIASPSEGSMRVTPVMEEILRLQLHIGMLVSSLSSTTNERNLMEQFGAPIGANYGSNSSRYYQRLMTFIKYSWNKLRELLSLGDENLCFFIHGILKELYDDPVDRRTLRNPSERDSLESVILWKIGHHFQTPRHSAAQFQEVFGSTAIKILTVLHEGIYENLFEPTPLDINKESKPTGCQLLWRVKEMAGYSHFMNYVDTRSKWVELKLLKFILKNEKRMKIIKYIAVILKWHSILFDIFQDNTITREQALSITNRQAIEHLPEELRDNAFKIFYEFAECFNLALPLIENIFECQRNPYLASDGSVDLSGAGALLGQGVQMSLDVSIMFSLPAMTEGLDDTMGLCSIKLLQLMQNTQTTLFNKQLLLTLKPSK